jgi:hypothetical protein
MILTFLNANVPLTKSYTLLPDGSIEKSSYPNVWEVTSINEDCPDLATMEKLLAKHAALGNCLLKGLVTRPLNCESRKGSTDRNATTEWLCLDIDGIEPEFVFKDEYGTYETTKVTVDYILEMLGLGKVSYILQWSGSQNVGNMSLRCHVFIMLSKAISAPLIKQWLIQKNHEVPLLSHHLSLTKTGNSLSWGLDITACQADKLIYIAPPTLKGIKNPLGRMARISLVKKTQATYELSGRINSTDQNRALTDARILELRDLAGLPKRKLTYKTVGAHEVLAKPGECIATEIKTDRGFVYFNLNGGDSWAYYHPEDNPDYIFNFKGEPTYLTKELLPAYWETLNNQAYRVSSTGQTFLAFLERRTSVYWRGTFDAANDNLKLFAAKNENMVRQFADSNGLRLGDNIPEWDMEFDPHSSVRVDFDNRTINTFQTTEFMRAPQPKRRITQCPPMIFKIINHVLCGEVDAIEHFQNWLAYIVQQRDRTRTGWVFQGVPGTGKGLLFNKILKPLFGESQTVMKRAGELSEKWTDYAEGKLIVFIDEIQSSALKDEAGVIANLKNLITEPTVMVRVMNRNAYAVNNYTNWLFASNKPDPIQVDKNDRRFNVGGYQGREFPRPTDEEVDSIADELQDYYRYLEAYPLDKQAASTPLQSAARNTLIELSQTTSESTSSAIQEGNLQYFLDQLPTGNTWKLNLQNAQRVEEYRKCLLDVMLRVRSTGACNIRRDELFIIFDYTVGGMSKSPTTFTKFLGHRQLTIKPISIDGKTERGIPVTWAEPEKLPELISSYFPEHKGVKV